MDSVDGDDLHHVLSIPITLSDRIRLAVNDAKSYKSECSDVGKQVDRLSAMLRSVVRFSTTTTTLYDRPVRCVFEDVTKTLTRALTLTRKCRRRSIILRFISIVGAADFRKLSIFLDTSIADVKWLLSIFDSAGAAAAAGAVAGVVLSLPPIATNDPILAWVWSYIASIHLCPLNVKIEIANELCSFANDNDRNKKIIVEEGGVPPLLKLLKENSLPEAQIAAATALFSLANNRDRARLIADELGIPIIVQVYGNSPIRVQIVVAKLIARMVENDQYSQEGFARENVIRPLVTSLSFETFVDDDDLRKQSIHSIVDMNTKMVREGGSSLSSTPLSVWSSNRKEKENESPELKLELKVSCARALWMLVRYSVGNSKRLTDTKGLLCLAKLIEQEKGELQVNCLMTVMEITTAAETIPDLRRTAFKTSSPAAKAIVDQLLRLIHESENPGIKIPAIRSIGSLARSFSVRETRVIGPLVEQLSHINPDVATESAIALGKFTTLDNFLCKEHSKNVIEFNGVPRLMRLLRSNETAKYHALILLCYLATNAGNSEALEQARVLTALEGAEKLIGNQYSELKGLLVTAIHHLSMYHHAGVVEQSYSP